jgi:hypothetical protein
MDDPPDSFIPAPAAMIRLTAQSLLGSHNRGVHFSIYHSMITAQFRIPITNSITNILSTVS